MTSSDREQTLMKYWEIVADKLSKAGWSLGWVSAVDSQGRTIWNADAHRGGGKRFVVRADTLRCSCHQYGHFTANPLSEDADKLPSVAMDFEFSASANSATREFFIHCFIHRWKFLSGI
jgi:hypothetical protein